MKKTIEVLVIVAMIGLFCSCGAEQEAADTMQMEPQLSQMKTISELATMKCYYHNVAEYYQKNASGYLLWKKDKNFCQMPEDNYAIRNYVDSLLGQ